MSENTRYSSEPNSERTHLDALDEAATQGEWELRDRLTISDNSGRTSDASDIAYVNDEKENWGDDWDADPEANAAFIVALVNAYRSGDLVPRVTSDEVRDALAFPVEHYRRFINRDKTDQNLWLRDFGNRCLDTIDTLTRATQPHETCTGSVSATAVPDEVREAWDSFVATVMPNGRAYPRAAYDYRDTIDRFIGGDE